MSEVRSGVFPATGRIVLGAAHFFKLIETPAPLDVTFEREGSISKAEDVEAGYGIPWAARHFERVLLDGPAGGTVKYIIGNEQAEYDRVVGVFEHKKANGGGQGNVGITNVANGVQIRAANLSRRKLYVFNNGADPVYAAYGAAVTAANGMPIPPGQERGFESTDQVRAIAAVAGPVDIRWMEELD